MLNQCHRPVEVPEDFGLIVTRGQVVDLAEGVSNTGHEPVRAPVICPGCKEGKSDGLKFTEATVPMCILSRQLVTINT